MLSATNYAINCLMTNIVDLDSIGCDIEPDRAEVMQAKIFIRALGCAPYALPVWQIGFGAYELFPIATNAAMYEALCELAAEGLSPDRVTVFVAPSKEAAAILACFVADFDDEDEDGSNDSYTGRYYAP
jgi:hypothetical protein